ncbi:DegV family protein [Salisediminibacterium halotolerans]|uniref:DegV family protein n=1 Tax=Salisediminibacterium halotolerans TaxID=517425 RepID=UPI000EB2870A|nr:DegV family protein [Salisediminibacterium halotolerans]RLJ74265.1 DegV family protein with EDD domain [Actinophytocola xinjiangensis]RPE87643.1 DegV family protein with EDD domain [Salisediminibacterium halotolerans]TWG35102.1 DegV family protein with EDD domain [Salisediminibacterium halotolerans]GEL06850.1 fatty acid-binding protein DegV [Salisediminibacterium halotolerans]
MSNVSIVTDSTADIPKELADELDITIIPLKVHFGENEVYEDGVDLTAEHFYKRLGESDTIPTTSQPTPYQFETVYRELHEKEPNKPILSIHLSAKMSGTHQSAYLASQNVSDDFHVTVIDSKRASYAIGIIVVELASMAKAGAQKDDLLERLDELLQDTEVFFMVETMEYLQKNGRIGKASALLGSLLKIKPILSLTEDGEVYPFDKVRGSKKAIQHILTELSDRYGDEPVHVGISHAESAEEAKKIMAEITGRFQVRKEVITDIGPVIGAHVGPGTISISVTKSKL